MSNTTNLQYLLCFILFIEPMKLLGAPTREEVTDQSFAGIKFEERQRQRLESLKQHILEKLKLDALPSINTHKLNKDSVPIHTMMQGYEEMDEEIERKKVITFATSAPFQDRGKISDNWFYFNFTEKEYVFDVSSAFLWVHIRPQISTLSRRPLIEIRQYEQDENVMLSPSSTYQIRPVNVISGRSGSWHKVGVTEIVQNWFRNSNQNYGIQVISKRILNLIETGNTDETVEMKPYLEVELISGDKRRKRSTPVHCTAGAGNTCCLHDLQVNFTAIGWDWVVYPTSYNARQCSGECDLTHSMRGKLVGLTSTQQRKYCCVPKKHSPLDMIYQDKNGTILNESIPEMQVTQCGCL